MQILKDSHYLVISTWMECWYALHIVWMDTELRYFLAQIEMCL